MQEVVDGNNERCYIEILIFINTDTHNESVFRMAGAIKLALYTFQAVSRTWKDSELA